MQIRTLLLNLVVLLSMADAKKSWTKDVEKFVKKVVEDPTYSEDLLEDIADIFDDAADLTRDVADKTVVFFDYMDYMFSNGLPI